MWDEELVLDIMEYLSIHEIPKMATPPQHPQPIPVTLPLQPNQGVPATLPLQPDQMEVPSEFKLMELDIQDDALDLIDIPKVIMSNLEARAQDVLSYQF